MMIRATTLRLISLVLLAFGSHALLAQTTVPATSPTFGDEFEGSLENWSVAPGSNLALTAGASHSGSKGLQVTVGAGESHVGIGGARPVARAEEAYLTFWFDPNGITVPTSGEVWARSIQIAAIKGENSKSLIALRFYQSGGQYYGWLVWREPGSAQLDMANTFVLPDRWQEITIGFRKDDWVAAWVDDSNVRSKTGVTHFEDYGSTIEVGHTLTTTPVSSGTLRFDEVELGIPRISDLWVNAASGSDGNDGLTPGTAFATIGRASALTGAGTTVHIQPGVYREAVQPAQGGTSGEPTLYKAEGGPGTVTLRGSMPSSDLNWTQLSTNTIGLPGSVTPSKVWWTDLSSWQLDGPPATIVRKNGQDEVLERLPLAREPDWTVTEEWKHSEHWWSARGGSSGTSCDPGTVEDCDASNRSATQLTDATTDGRPGVEAGNLSTLGNLTGAVLRAKDCIRGHFHYRRNITAHNVAAGRVTVDEPAYREGTDPGLGWGTMYFVESHPALLDTAGEWWFDEATDRLYLWPPSPWNPGSQNLEIPRYETAFDLSDRSYVELRDLKMELYNGVIVSIVNWVSHKSVGVTLRGNTLSWSDTGIAAEQPMEAGEHLDKRIESLLVVDNEIEQMDTWAIMLTQRWNGGSAADNWERSGLFDTVIKDNEMHHLGFRISEEGDRSTGGIALRHADRFTFEDNRIHDTATEGVFLAESVIQSPNTYDFSPSEIKIGEILFRNNVFERNCQMKGDCGSLRLWAKPPDKHVFRDLLVIGNEFRDTLGWSWAADQRELYLNGQISGAGGSGLYLDGASGLHVYRNVAYNNGNAGFYLIRYWRDGEMYLYNNVLANNGIGIRLGGLEFDTHVNVDTRVLNNILINNASYGVVVADLDSSYTNTVIDRNLYEANGWLGSVFSPGDLNILHTSSQEYYPTVSQIRAGTPFEDAGQDGTARFVDYDLADHVATDASWPDFRLQTGSDAADGGSTGLPAGLDSLLSQFAISETRMGSAWDQGAHEGVTGTAEIFSDGFESGGTNDWTN